MKTRFPNKKNKIFVDFRNLQIAVIVSNGKALAETLEKYLFEFSRFFNFSGFFLIFQGS